MAKRIPTDSQWASLVSKIKAKQDKLVSGTNIKTINGVSILGSGNLNIVGAGGATIKQISTSISSTNNVNISLGESVANYDVLLINVTCRCSVYSDRASSNVTLAYPVSVTAYRSGNSWKVSSPYLCEAQYFSSPRTVLPAIYVYNTYIQATLNVAASNSPIIFGERNWESTTSLSPTDFNVVAIKYSE